MNKVQSVAILVVILLATLSGCILNRPLDACLQIIEDPAGDPMTRLFSAACSTHFGDPFYPTAIYTFKWYFGDGHKRTVHGNLLTTYTYREPGTYKVELLLIGPDGETSRARREVTIEEL